jgi:hypothetical protein
VLRKIYAPKRDEVTGSRGVEKNLCRGSNIWVIKSRRMRWAGACSIYWGEERSMHDFDGERDNLEDMRRWEDNIKMGLRELGWAIMD